jgi:hypothetical protein
VSDTRPPSVPETDAERALRERLRAALASVEPARVPPFERLWSQARRPRRVRLTMPALAAAAAGAFVLAAVLFRVVPDLRDSAAPLAGGTAQDDYRLALELSARFAAPSPLDALTPPPPMTRGLPSLSEYRYPLLPEEISL